MAPVHRVFTLMSSPFMRWGIDAGSLISSSKAKSGIYHSPFSPSSFRSMRNFHVPARFMMSLVAPCLSVFLRMMSIDKSFNR